ncbi:MAG: plastocyanin/azurin family copper-binding protein [Gammaproteobacteria bacterium]|nr:plastocyanin/azurin family copper-binding protein [Gammaproteobacteria bacterium]MDH5802409.1 plastocyanin/azurin family copper-binding protein [Gammaproteobacteria bacterium]
MFNKIFFLVVLSALCTTAYSEEHIISQNELKFNPPIKVIKPGDTLTFRNSDSVVHNIISQTEEFQFDLGKFKPGMMRSLQFKSKGVVDIECTVHPSMKMTLFIF